MPTGSAGSESLGDGDLSWRGEARAPALRGGGGGDGAGAREEAALQATLPLRGADAAQRDAADGVPDAVSSVGEGADGGATAPAGGSDLERRGQWPVVALISSGGDGPDGGA